MDEYEVLAERFEAHRPRLRAVAYQMLNSASEAKDAVQETCVPLPRVCWLDRRLHPGEVSART